MAEFENNIFGLPKVTRGKIVSVLCFPNGKDFDTPDYGSHDLGTLVPLSVCRRCTIGDCGSFYNSGRLKLAKYNGQFVLGSEKV